MKCLFIVFCHAFLFASVWCSPLENNTKDVNSTEETTTQLPQRTASTTKNINKEQVQNANNAQTEKPLTKKRDIPGTGGDKLDYVEDDFYEGKSNEDYDNIQALRSYLDNHRNENSEPEPERHRDLNKISLDNDFRYYNGESRRKRTAVFDGLFNKPDGYYEPEVQLSPEDIMALATYKQQHRMYNNFPYSRWSNGNNPTDFQEADADGEDDDDDDDSSLYNDRQESFFDRLYDQRYQNWANLPRKDKFIANRRRRNFLGHPRLRVPLFRRVIL